MNLLVRMKLDAGEGFSISAGEKLIHRGKEFDEIWLWAKNEGGRKAPVTVTIRGTELERLSLIKRLFRIKPKMIEVEREEHFRVKSGGIPVQLLSGEFLAEREEVFVCCWGESVKFYGFVNRAV